MAGLGKLWPSGCFGFQLPPFLTASGPFLFLLSRLSDTVESIPIISSQEATVDVKEKVAMKRLLKGSNLACQIQGQAKPNCVAWIKDSGNRKLKTIVVSSGPVWCEYDWKCLPAGYSELREASITHGHHMVCP